MMVMIDDNDGQVVLPPVTTPTEMTYCAMANRLVTKFLLIIIMVTMMIMMMIIYNRLGLIV